MKSPPAKGGQPASSEIGLLVFRPCTDTVAMLEPAFLSASIQSSGGGATGDQSGLRTLCQHEAGVTETLDARLLNPLPSSPPSPSSSAVRLTPFQLEHFPTEN